MGEIIEKRRRHYSGLDADKASILAGAKEVGDQYFATDKLKLYYWQGGSWKTGLGYEYVPLPHPAAQFTQATLVTDGTWKVDGMDCTGIVPEGTIAIDIRIRILDDAANSNFRIRQSTPDGARSQLALTTQIANIDREHVGTIGIDADRLLDYLGTNLVFTVIEVDIIGYYI